MLPARKVKTTIFITIVVLLMTVLAVGCTNAGTGPGVDEPEAEQSDDGNDPLHGDGGT